MDQNYIQRYQTTASSRDAIRSLWLCVKLYVPVSLLFFIIGSALYAWYQVHPEMLQSVRMRVAAEHFTPGVSRQELEKFAVALKPADYGDRILPDFMVNILPAGIVGLIVSAILSAAMSTISSGINASATVFTFDIYQRYIKNDLTQKQVFRILLSATFIVGVLATLTGIAMIGVKSILDAWWQLSGIFGAGMLGLFLLGLVSRQVQNREALLATITGVFVIAWLSLPGLIPEKYAMFRSSLNINMTIVVGTLSIFCLGILLTKLRGCFSK